MLAFFGFGASTSDDETPAPQTPSLLDTLLGTPTRPADEVDRLAALPASPGQRRISGILGALAGEDRIHLQPNLGGVGRVLRHHLHLARLGGLQRDACGSACCPETSASTTSPTSV